MLELQDLYFLSLAQSQWSRISLIILQQLTCTFLHAYRLRFIHSIDSMFLGTDLGPEPSLLRVLVG